MYLEGFTPDEIIYANRIRIQKMNGERKFKETLESTLAQIIEEELFKEFK